MRELALWGPAHDSLLDGAGEPSSTNFHRLSSGAYAISRTTAAGNEYSGRGALVYTQFLVVPAELLARFANNPFAVVRAATASGALTVHEQIPEVLDAIRLTGRTPAVDSALLAQLGYRPGPTAMATLLQAALSSDQLAVASTTPAETLLAGLLNLLPVECRPNFSFSTGLKFSPSRPFRVSALPCDPASWRGIGRHGVTLLNLDSGEQSEVPCWEGWAGTVAEILASGRISMLASQLERKRPGLTCAKLPEFAAEIEAILHPAMPEQVVAVGQEPSMAAEATGDNESMVPDSEAEICSRRADDAHTRFDATTSGRGGAAKLRVDDLVEILAAQPPEVLALLERVDDLVFTAIGGDQQALADLELLWPSVVADVDPDVVEQSREQYLRCALSMWGDRFDGDVNQPERAVSAIGVLCVLFDK